MIGTRIGSKLGPRIGSAVGTGADEVGAGGAVAAAPVFVAVGASAAVGSAGTLQVLYPTGGDAPVANDVALLVIETHEQNTGANPQAFSDAQGFVEGPDSGQTPDTWTNTVRWYWKRCVGGDTGPTFADVTNDGHKVCRILLFRGVTATGDPWDVTDGDFDADVDTAVTIPGGTTTGTNRYIVSVVAWGTDSAAAQSSSEANAALTGVAELVDGGTALGGGGGFAVIGGVKAAAGVFGATTCTLAAGANQARLMIALRPD